MKLCPECRAYCHTRLLVCPECGFEFPPPKQKELNRTASTDAVMVESGSVPVFEDFNVYQVIFRRHLSRSGTDCVRVCYQIGASTVSEYMVFRPEYFFRHKMDLWWSHRGGKLPSPADPDEFLSRTGELICPATVRVITNKLHPDVVGVTMPLPSAIP